MAYAYTLDMAKELEKRTMHMHFGRKRLDGPRGLGRNAPYPERTFCDLKKPQLDKMI